MTHILLTANIMCSGRITVHCLPAGTLSPSIFFSWGVFSGDHQTAFIKIEMHHDIKAFAVNGYRSRAGSGKHVVLRAMVQYRWPSSRWVQCKQNGRHPGWSTRKRMKIAWRDRLLFNLFILNKKHARYSLQHVTLCRRQTFHYSSLYVIHVNDLRSPLYICFSVCLKTRFQI